MFKKRSKKNEESALQPNEALSVDSIASYQNVFTKEKDTGHFGLLTAYQEKTTVTLVVENEEDTETITGTISHYDENYSQLVMIVENSLKRLTFDQIVDVIITNGGGLSDEKLSD